MTKERPILMSGEMVRAILDGRKTQTRRVIRKINGFREFFFDDDRKIIDAQSMLTRRGPNVIDSYGCPYGQVGDRLWIRETWQMVYEDKGGNRTTEHNPMKTYVGGWYEYAATCRECPPRWRPSIHMPRKASRLTLEITAVRVERLQTITDEDALAEGFKAALIHPEKLTALYYFKCFWHAINGKRAPWASNPFVWVIEFKRLESTK